VPEIVPLVSVPQLLYMSCDFHIFARMWTSGTLTSGTISGRVPRTLTGTSYALNAGTVSAILAGASAAVIKDHRWNSGFD